ncbi:amidoligase family protein [Acutalibacter caecimuris]|uniref:amidoligase family protein n=1 Tax=Acutalibacter caecimuris TaxID=3093657 RepID=UPI002AC9C9EA|nr:amidoligase family protein [Acutalibacter sp. M00118]
MRTQKFGIEIEMTGITRAAAVQVIAGHFGTSATHVGGGYDTYTVRDNDNRQWKVVSDASIRRESRRGESRNSAYAVEFVSPICKYEDIETIQELIRKLRSAGAKVNASCGIHVHIDASPHDVKTLRNIVNIMAAKEELLYKTLKVNVNREHYCAKADTRFLDELNAKRPTSMDTLESIWYNGRSGRNYHYDESRYHGFNLHSVFSKGTIEFRLFNSTLHAGEIKSYIQLCMAISHQALVQKSASRIKTQSSNEKYTFRVWLLRLGLIGDEFKTARHHLLKNLDGNIAWKDPAQAEAQKQRLAEKRLAESVAQAMELAPVPPISEEDEAQDESEEPRMSM